MELSIVLIIIGLIVGGVLGGQSLIKSAELQRVVNDLRQYETAVNAFRLEFNSLPGDMNNAFDYWQSSCGGGTKATCNGNGDGFVNEDEEFSVFNHMSLAGIVPGSFKNTGDDSILIPDVNVPSLPAISAVMSFDYCGTPSAPCEFWGRKGGHGFAVEGATKDDKGNWSRASTSNAKIAKTIDVKIDDGLPAIGNLRAYNLTGVNACVQYTDENDTTSDVLYRPSADWPDYPNSPFGEFRYKLSEKNKTCNFNYMLYGL